ncbi:hypothetical protein OG729_36440 [Streptomyces sp. NBC_00210]|uniref:hypothetical protein n=1 Tax=unclassified Streptomyces TaxID=2593676 RepID=UPI0032491CCC
MDRAPGELNVAAADGPVVVRLDGPGGSEPAAVSRQPGLGAARHHERHRSAAG